MKTSTCVLIAVAAFLLGYYFSAKVSASFIGKILTPSA